MKHYYATLALCLGAIAANAQDIQVAGPYGSTIVIDRMNCPDGVKCVRSDRFGVAPDHSRSVLLLPEWATPLLSDGAPSLEISAYVRGISDSKTFDICSYCNCCIISQDLNSGNFAPWNANQFDHLRNISPYGPGQ